MIKVIKKAFVVIGKEGSTLDGAGFIQKLWDDANGHFSEVAHLAKKDTNGNIIPDTLTLSFKNQIINQKLSTYVSFLNKMTGSEREQYTQTLQELENQLLNDNTEIHKTAPASNSTNNIPDSTFSDPSYQKIQNLLSDCTPQEMEWILKSVQLIKACLRDTK